MQGYSLISPPVAEPLSLTEVKNHLRYVDDDQDELIDSLIVAARMRVETDTRRSLLTQTYQLSLSRFPVGRCAIALNPFLVEEQLLLQRGLSIRNGIHLDHGPVQSISSFTYVDDNGNEQTLSESDYIFDNNRETEAVIVPAYGTTWPVCRIQPGAVLIRFVCGYGDTPDAIPEPLKVAMRLLIGTWFQNRELSIVGVSSTDLPQPATFDAIL
ncbi:MAG TPA: head-tail connector protein, partial [Chroococcales cyanobacterium]